MKESLSTKMHIFECAIKLFKESGYDNITIKNICEKAEIAKSTFYYYYQTKDDLLKDFFSTIDINAQQTMQALIIEDNCLEQMWKIIELYYLWLIEAGIEIARMVYMSNLVQDKYMFGIENAKSKDIFLALLKRAREQKIMKNIYSSDEELLISLLHTLIGISYFWCVQNAKFDLLAECRKNFETVLGYKP